MLQMSSSSNYERQSDNNGSVNNVNQMSRSNRGSKKKSTAPFLFITNMLKKKKILGFEEISRNHSKSEPSVVSYSCSLSTTRQPAVSSLSLTPARLYSKKDLEYDMQQLKLSRSDNPYIQKKLASRDEINMIDIDETADDDTNLIPSLMSQESDNDDFFDVISHDHLIRSPPPVFRPIGSTFNFPSIDDGDETDDYHFPHFPEKQRANSTPKTHYTNSTRSSLSELKFA